MSVSSAPRVLTPSMLNRLVRDLLGDALPQVWVEGELSNMARPASGHLYFTLKDAAAQIRCAMFRGDAGGLRFRPEAGQKVLLRAKVGLYEARGDYQLVVEHMEEAGLGALQRAFDELKTRLQAEGLFADGHKQPLPAMPRRIGVITSPSGAAIRDVLNVLGRRFPLVHVDVLPVPVQGKQAPPAIVAMLARANLAMRHDVLLLTRGGGSLEDLWAFNDEAVARAIHASRIPVMSAVGHEVDFSISDFVADARAPTPSAAAELLVPDAQDLQQRLRHACERLLRRLQQRLQAQAQRLDHLQTRLQHGNPCQRLQHGRERLQSLRQRLRQWSRNRLRHERQRLAPLTARLRRQHPGTLLAAAGQRAEAARLQLHRQLTLLQQARRTRLTQAARLLQAASPLAAVQRGYAIVRDPQGQVLRSASGIQAGTVIDIELADGRLRARTE